MHSEIFNKKGWTKIYRYFWLKIVLLRDFIQHLFKKLEQQSFGKI
jgi:hypothetical protein